MEMNEKEIPTTGNISSSPVFFSHSQEADDVENNGVTSSDLELLKYKIKSVDAKKILRLLEDAIAKIETIAYVEYLKDSISDVELTEEEREAVSVFCELQHRAYVDYKGCLENKQNLSDCDAFIKLASALNRKSRNFIPQQSSSGLGDLCCNLRAFELIIVERFSKTPVEVKKERKVLKDLKKHVEGLSKMTDVLQKDLQDSESQKKEIEKSYEHIIEELQLEINRIEWLATDKMDSNVKQANKAIKKFEQEGQGVVVKLDGQVANIKGTLDECMHNNLQEEMTLRKNRRQIQEEITKLIKKYDIEMGDRQSRYDYLYKEYMDELEKEKRLSVQVVELKKVYDVIMEEMQKKEAERERLEAELEQKTSAAVIIQKVWRGYRTRKMLKGGDKKEKGKKSGKKGKKK